MGLLDDAKDMVGGIMDKAEGVVDEVKDMAEMKDSETEA